jgi:hypothetical protein
MKNSARRTLFKYINMWKDLESVVCVNDLNTLPEIGGGMECCIPRGSCKVISQSV